jgi:hypothetical protein
MPVAEIAAAIQSVRASFDLTKAAIGLRDAEAFRTRSVELNGLILQALEKAIDARESQAAQLDRISALEAEVARLKAWDAEKEKYELKAIGHGCVAYMLKPEARGTEPPHWLCPNCYAQGKKAFIQPSGARSGRDMLYKCVGCGGTLATDFYIAWID